VDVVSYSVRAQVQAWTAWALAAVAATTGGCLPKDSRPVPAEVFVQASADDATINGFTTDDGWRVEFSRFLVTFGRSSLDGDSCNPYSEAGYERILDMQQPSPQKVALMYGLGTCDFSFGVVHPVTDSVVGAGVTSDEALMMRTAGSDVYTAFSGQLTGITTVVVGTAKKGTESKSFSWAFRQDHYYDNCSIDADAGTASSLNLHGQDLVTIDLMVRGETFFKTYFRVSPTTPTEFDVFATADTSYGNNDGQVTLDELAQVPLSDLVKVSPRPQVDAGSSAPVSEVDAGSRGVDASVGHTPLVAPSTLGDWVYYAIFPRMIQYQGTGYCTATTTRPGRGR
jgi:hypothetical protein